MVIGAGYTGASVVHHLLDGNDDVGKSIVILEARGACSGATGRNGKYPRVILDLRIFVHGS